ncbi:MAG: sigma-70 family RNA polymerase sigma factor [Candidatus Hydrogenedentes bacterium]|nr:sigma-70 family RNA polymerase sigma factor [Candidatus Hydrogenedentota bacterium]
MNARGSQTADLIARCTTGDDAARAQFCGEYLGIVRQAAARTLHRYGASGADALETDDLANEIFEKLLANNCALLNKVRHSRTITAWLVAITRNHVIDHLRRESLRERVATRAHENHAPFVPPVTIGAIAGERAEAVRNAVYLLESRDRFALELYFLQGLTYVQMADILGENVNTVSARVRRAKGKLRQVLEQRGIRER